MSEREEMDRLRAELVRANERWEAQMGKQIEANTERGRLARIIHRQRQALAKLRPNDALRAACDALAARDSAGAKQAPPPGWTREPVPWTPMTARSRDRALEAAQEYLNEWCVLDHSACGAARCVHGLYAAKCAQADYQQRRVLAAWALRFAAETHEHCPHACMRPCPSHRVQDDLRREAAELEGNDGK